MKPHDDITAQLESAIIFQIKVDQFFKRLDVIETNPMKKTK